VPICIALMRSVAEATDIKVRHLNAWRIDNH
jgi:hypothetical protein